MPPADTLALRLMLDSGAYSAYTRGRPIDLDHYIRFCAEQAGKIDRYVNMDQVPGKPGKQRTALDYEEAAAVSFKNYLIMREAGLNPLPVFHQGEDFRWLWRYFEHTNYIGVSLAKDGRSAEHKRFLDELFPKLDLFGPKQIRLHGFGITSLSILSRYPWYSFDSTTWARQAGCGRLVVPSYHRGLGEFDYLDPPLLPIVTGFRHRHRNGLMLEDLDAESLHGFDVFCQQVVGVPIYAVRSMPWARCRWCLVYTQKVAQACREHHDCQMHLRFDGSTNYYAACAPSMSIASYTDIQQHQEHHLLSFDRLARYADAGKALDSYIARESDYAEHGRARATSAVEK